MTRDQILFVLDGVIGAVMRAARFARDPSLDPRLEDLDLDGGNDVPNKLAQVLFTLKVLDEVVGGWLHELPLAIELLSEAHATSDPDPIERSLQRLLELRQFVHLRDGAPHSPHQKKSSDPTSSSGS